MAGFACGEDAGPAVVETPRIAVESIRIDFGRVAVGAQETRELVLTNLSGVEAPVAVTLPGSFEGQLPSQVVLRPEERRTWTLTYAPTEPGETLDASVTFECTAPAACSASVALAGAATVAGRLQIVSERVDFTLLAVGLARTRSVLMTNVGDAPLSIDVALTGDAVFSVDVSSVSLAPGEADVVNVSFAPDAVGASAARLVFTAGDDVQELMVAGEGVGKDHCVYATVPPSLNFGVVATGRTFQRTIEFSNEGTLACHLAVETTGELVSVEGGPASVELAPGGTAAFTMTVGGGCDDCEGALLAQINGELAEQIYATRTTGTSDGVLLLPAEVDFGSVCVGDTPRGRQVTVYNTSANAKTIASVALKSGDDFGVVAPPLPTTLASGEAMVFGVELGASRTGEAFGRVEIVLESGESYFVTLHGILDSC
ncbi:MAG: choice-of-anchor D domain-containing protein [Deltaproteobacteria bacterium]